MPKSKSKVLITESEDGSIVSTFKNIDEVIIKGNKFVREPNTRSNPISKGIRKWFITLLAKLLFKLLYELSKYISFG